MIILNVKLLLLTAKWFSIYLSPIQYKSNQLSQNKKRKQQAILIIIQNIMAIVSDVVKWEIS